MNRQDYKEAAERLLRRAEDSIANGYSNANVERYTAIARVWAMLAAIPEVQDNIPFAQNI